MRVLQSSDWHLGQTLYGQSRVDEHRHSLAQIVQICLKKSVDVLVICGDVYDSYNPSAQAEDVWYSFLKSISTLCPTLKIFVISGNHDSSSRLKAPLPVLKDLRVEIISELCLTQQGTLDPDTHLKVVKCGDDHSLVLGLVPYIKPSDYPFCNAEIHVSVHEYLKSLYEALALEAAKTNFPILMTGHLFASGASVSENSERKIQRGNLEALSLTQCQFPPLYFALGHLHKAQSVSLSNGQAFYSGSLFPLSFAEANYKHRVVLLSWESEETRIPESEFIYLDRPRPIVSIGQKDMPAQQVFDLITHHEMGSQKSNNLTPFIEIKALVEPGKAMEWREKFEQIIHSKNGILLNFQPHFLNSVQWVVNQENQKELEVSLLELEPTWVFKKSYEERWGQLPNQELENLFSECLAEAAQHSQNSTK